MCWSGAIYFVETFSPEMTVNRGRQNLSSERALRIRDVTALIDESYFRAIRGRDSWLRVANRAPTSKVDEWLLHLEGL